MDERNGRPGLNGHDAAGGTVSLRDMQPGEKGVVVGWLDDGPPIRLLEMGLLEGTEFEIVRFAPFGDPIDIRIRGYHLSLRKSEAARVRVERH